MNCLSRTECNPEMEESMKFFNLSAAAMLAAGMSIAAPVFAQQAPAQKQRTQEGGPSMPDANANQGPTYKQPIQSEVPSMPNPATLDASKSR